MSEFGDYVCRGRRYHQGVNGLGNRNVLDRGFDVRLLSAYTEKIGSDFFPAERSKSKRTNKLLGGASHDDLNPHATVLQKAHQLRSLVSGNPTGDSQSDLHIGRL